MSESKHKYKELPHGCEKKTYARKADGRNYKRSRHASEYGDHDWYVESRKHPGRWRRLERSVNAGEKDYFLTLALETEWEKRFESNSESASAEEQPPTRAGEHYSKFGLDKQGRELFETVKLKDGRKLYFSFNLMEGKKGHDRPHWLRFFMQGKHLRFAFDDETTLRFAKRVLVGLSPKLLLKAVEFGKEKHDERTGKSKRP